MKWLRKWLRKNKQKIYVQVYSIKDNQWFYEVPVGAKLELYNDDPDKPNVSIDLEGLYTIRGIKITINPWKFQKFFKFGKEE